MLVKLHVERLEQLLQRLPLELYVWVVVVGRADGAWGTGNGRTWGAVGGRRGERRARAEVWARLLWVVHGFVRPTAGLVSVVLRWCACVGVSLAVGGCAVRWRRRVWRVLEVLLVA